MVLNEIVCHEMDLKEDGSLGSAAKDYQFLPNDDALREIERLSSTVIRRPKHKHASFPEPHKVSFFLRTGYAAVNPIEAFGLLNEE